METQTPHNHIIAPAPWELKGNGHIGLYRFSKKFVENNGFFSNFQQKANFKGIIGSVMMVDYHTSNVGAYQELLFIPGMFGFDLGKSGEETTNIAKNIRTGFNISKIYVSSPDSVWNGRENWGIPKELADFKVENTENTSKNKIESFEASISIDEKPFFKATLQPKGISFPVNTGLFPFTFYHPLRGKTLITKPHGKGWAKFCTLKTMDVDSNFFPDLSQCKPLAFLSVKDFVMRFPVAEVV
jgi:hypothetical protein